MSKLRKFASVIVGVLAVPFLSVGYAHADAGTATYYNDVGYGACGTQINAATDWLVAAPAALWTSPNPNNDPLCGKSIDVTYNGNTITVPIRDKCPSCDPTHIDLSQPAFAQFADLGVGVINVDWHID